MRERKRAFDSPGRPPSQPRPRPPSPLARTFRPPRRPEGPPPRPGHLLDPVPRRGPGERRVRRLHPREESRLRLGPGRRRPRRRLPRRAALQRGRRRLRRPEGRRRSHEGRLRHLQRAGRPGVCRVRRGDPHGGVRRLLPRRLEAPRGADRLRGGAGYRHARAGVPEDGGGDAPRRRPRPWGGRPRRRRRQLAARLLLRARLRGSERGNQGVRLGVGRRRQALRRGGRVALWRAGCRGAAGPGGGAAEAARGRGRGRGRGGGGGEAREAREAALSPSASW